MEATFSSERFPKQFQKPLLWTALIIGILIKCLLLYFYALVDGDKGLQALAAVNIARGNGYTIPEYNLLTQQLYNMPLLEWPPLYSLMLVPFLYLTGFNLEWSCLLLDACAGISLLVFLLLLLRKLGFPVWLQALIILFKSAELNAATLLSFPTDTWATAAVIGALYFLLRAIDRQDMRTIILFAVLNVLPFYFRYMYLPIVFILPALFAWRHFKIIPLRPKLYVMAGITLFAVAGLLLYNRVVTDETVFMITSKRGYYPETLQTMAPVFWAAFINVDFYSMQVSLHSSLSYKNFHTLLKATSAFLLVLLIIQYARRIKSLIRNQGPVNNFFLYGGALSISIVMVIVLLSLLHSPYSAYNENDFWTFVMEERYFAVPSIVILVTACWWMFSVDSRFRLLQKICRMLFVAIVTIEVLHAAYIIMKKSNTNPHHYSAYILANEQRKMMLDKVFAAERKKGMDIVLVSDQYGYIMEGAMRGIKVSRNVTALEKELTFTHPTTLLFVIPSERSGYFDPVIRKHGFELIPVSENYYLYKKSYLTP